MWDHLRLQGLQGISWGLDESVEITGDYMS